MHLYVHIPFCARRCSYCDFAIAVRSEVPSLAFTDAVVREWSTWVRHPGWDSAPVLDTIYFGGGTPSRLEPAALAELLSRFGEDRPLAPEAEVTLEANPDDVTPERTEAWLRMGVNRVSLGAQSFSPAALAWMHRTHDAAQIATAVHTLRAGGFQNFSLDLIYALPASLQRSWSQDLESALVLEPTHLSLYGLTVEAGTPLARWTARGTALPLPDERAAEEYLEAHERLEQGGFEHYEVSNAARPGFRARHNSAYWQRRPFIGLGPSAHSALGNTRAWNVREWEDYRRRAAAGQPVGAASEQLTPAQVDLEELYLGLRTLEGVPSTQLPAGARARWAAAGWASVTEDRVRLTPEGWLRLDALVASLTHC